jgi:hypothetical protein
VIEEVGHAPFLLSQARVYRNTREATFSQQLIQFDRPRHALYENNNLIEVEGVQEVIKLAILLALVEADKVLLEAMEGELWFVVDEDFEWLDGRRRY